MLQKQIEHWIKDHQEDMLADIDQLVRFKSISRKEDEPKIFGEECAEALEWILSLGAGYGFDTYNAQYRCGVISHGQQSKSVGIWSHLDVVPEGSGWLYPPYESTRKGNFIIGRGVQDNKGPCIAVLYAMRCIRELNIPLKYTVKQIVGCAEETGMEDVVYFVEYHEVPDFNFVADCGFPVCYGEKGMMEVDLCLGIWSEAVLDFYGGNATNIVPDHAELVMLPSDALDSKLDALSREITVKRDKEVVRLSAKGVPGHAAFPVGTVNAMYKLLKAVLDADILEVGDKKIGEFICAVCGTNDGSALQIATSDELSGELTCVGTIARKKNRKALISVNIRYPITTDARELHETIIRTGDEWGVTLQNIHVSEPNHCEKDSANVQTLTDTYNRVMFTQAEPFVMGGGTYARKIPNTVAFGPGLPADISVLGLPEGHGSIHSPDEAQSIPNLLAALTIYVMALIALNETI